MQLAFYVVGFVAAGLGCAAMFRPIPRVGLTDGPRALATVALGLLFVMIGTQTNQPTPPPARPMSPEAALSRRVRTLLAERQARLSTWKLHPPGAAGDTVEAEWLVARGFTTIGVWETVRQVSQAVHESGLAGGGQVWLRVRVPTRDDFGNAGTGLGLSLRFDPDTLRRVNWAEVDPWRLGRVATVIYIHPRLNPSSAQ